MPHQTRGNNKHGTATKNSRQGNGGCPYKIHISNSTKGICCICRGGQVGINRIVKSNNLKKNCKKNRHDFTVN